MPEPIERIVAAMSSPRFYPHAPDAVEVIQTHISWVFLAGEFVFKLKKPVRFSFLDFSTAAARRRFCEDEVRLNRRLAPDVYLGVVGIRVAGDGFALGAADAAGVLETAVHMRRLPAERLLPALLLRDEVDTAVLGAIVDRLVAFHASADAGPEVQAWASPEKQLAAMDRDFAEMDRFRGKTIEPEDDDALRAHCREGIERHADLLRQRARAGRVRDGHGDLHAEHVCVLRPQADGVVVFDCIEFNAEFRCRDVAAEIAFLAMDLEFRGHPDLARWLIDDYATKADDPQLPALVPLFACHRAYIRGKVDSLKSEEKEVGGAERAAARKSATAHFELAYRYTWSGRAALVVVHGLSGSGKSTFAGALARRTGFAHLASDVIRKDLAGLAATDRSGAAPGADLYSAAMSARTYAEMLACAERQLEMGRGVVLDATFQRRSERAEALRLARRLGWAVVLVECLAGEEEITRRLAERARRDDDASDATVEVYREQRRRYEPWSAEETAVGERVSTTNLRDALRRVERRLAAG